MRAKRKNRWVAVLLSVLLINQSVPEFVFAEEAGGQIEMTQTDEAEFQEMPALVYEAAEDAGEEILAWDAAEEASGDIMPEMVEEAAEESGGQIAEEMLDEAAELAADESILEPSDEVAEGFGGEIAEEMLDEAAEPAADEGILEPSDEPADELADGFGGEIVEEMIDESPEEAAGEAFEEPADATAEEAAGQIAEEFADEEAWEIAEAADEEIQEENTEEALEENLAELETETVEESFEENAEAEEPAAFTQSQTVNGVVVTVAADPGVFPTDAVLSVSMVPTSAKEEADAAIGDVRDADVNVAVSYTFDIKVIDPVTGEELQPADGQMVSVSFALAEAADENLDTAVYHVTEEEGGLNAEALPVTEESGDSVTVETDGFSLYTVEFTYDTLTYVLPGGEAVALSEILNEVGLKGDAQAVSVSSPALFSASDETGEWVVTSHKPFATTEWMKVTIAGVEYEITVTDADEGMLEPVPYIDEDGNALTPVEDYVLLKDVTWDSLSLNEKPYYVVQGSVNIKGEAVVSGERTIILCDDAEFKCEGLIVSDDNTINIYCQSGKSGKLTSEATRVAGIGGRAREKTGTINIYGGVINASSTSGGGYQTECAGIGSGDEGRGGTINIYGGSVTATGDKYAAGIGSGDQAISAESLTVNIYGGTVTATGGDYAAGIGTGDKASSNYTINISGGTVTANGGEEAAGIGGGNEVAGGTINISGGTVTATSKKYGAGIGGGDKGRSGLITISGGTVTATGGEDGAGIGSGDSVAKEDQNKPGAGITISGGTVTATGGKNGAGIGGGNDVSGAIITITGGENITANGGSQAAGIGGGKGKSADTIRIKGGKVNATGGDGGAGIGGGYKGSGGMTEIEDGEITATGGDGGTLLSGGAGAGIGGGDNGTSGIIKIYGGTITAKGGSASQNYGIGGAGIGGGDNGKGELIEIFGGSITATGGGKKGDVDISDIADSVSGSGGAGIGGGDGANSGIINISGGKITATGGKSAGGGGAGIGGGDSGNGEDITITGGNIRATGGGEYYLSKEVTWHKGGAGIGGGDKGSGGNIKIDLMGGEDVVGAYGCNDGSAIGGGNDAGDGNLELGVITEAFSIEFGSSREEIATVVSKAKRVKVCRGNSAKLTACKHENIIKYVDLGEKGHQRICRNCYVELLDKEDPLPHVLDEKGVCTLCGVPEGEGVPYLDESGMRQECTDYLFFEAETAEADGLEDGKWYVVDQTDNELNFRLVISGDIHIILCDGCDLSANQGIEVKEGASLTIYGQGGKAYLEAYGGGGNAGVGGNSGSACGSVTICDIIVDATGGEGAAAIGGGKGSQYRNITLNRCSGTATGGKGGAGIGGGAFEKENSGNSGTISISYGSITANGGLGAAGIGGGKYQSGGTIVIDGVQGGNVEDLINTDAAKITAMGGKNDAASGAAAGIGGGEFGDGGSITIKGGVIYAGGGENTTRVFTTSGGGGAGIGGGAGASGGSITIEGGLVYGLGGMTKVIGVRDGGGAGIGGGDAGAAGNITILGGEIYATGGTASVDRNGGGAGVGGGDAGDGGTISILGGSVEARGYGNGVQAFGRGDGGSEGELNLGDGMCVYKGMLSMTTITADDLYTAENRVSGCRSTDVGMTSVAPCWHLDASYEIADPANSGHFTTCRYCLINPTGLQKHELDAHAECVCGYHGVILNFKPGDAGDDAGSMDPVVLPGDTEYTLPEVDYFAPYHYVSDGWLIDGKHFDEKKGYTTPATKETTVELDAVAQWTMSEHVWNEPTYTWSDDNTTVTASHVCKLDSTHTETETVATTMVITTKATESEDGVRTYTAQFKNAAFKPQTRTEAIPATGHIWGKPTYTWSKDNKTVTAERMCTLNSSHKDTETVAATSSVTKEATATKDGERVFTAAFKNPAFQKQTKTEAIPATGEKPKPADEPEKPSDPKITVPKVTGLKTFGVYSRRSFILNYDPAEGASDYEVSFRKLGGEWKSAGLTGGKTSYTLSGLDVSEEYDIRVRALTKAGGKNIYGPYSNKSHRWVVKTSYTLTAKNDAFKVEVAPVKDADGYLIAWADNAEYTNASFKKLTGGKTAYTVRNLKAGTKYYFAVRPYKVENTVTYSGIFSARSRTAVAKPAKVTGIKASANAAKRTIVIRFPKVKKAADYQIAYRIAGTKAWKLVRTRGKTTYTLKNLKAGKTYQVRVRAVVRSGPDRLYGSYSKGVKKTVKKANKTA